LFRSEQIEYLVVGGYAVAYHGYPRATGDMDVWVAINPQNAAALSRALTKFGFSASAVPDTLFLQSNQVVRMGVPPLRIDLLTTATGVEFSDCYSRRMVATIDGVEVNFIHVDDLKRNKLASGRNKDLNDL
jgi:hypothetical protein